MEELRRRRVERVIRPSIPRPSIPAEGDPRRSSSRLIDVFRGADEGLDGMREVVEGEEERRVARRVARVDFVVDESAMEGGERRGGVLEGLVEGETA